MVCGARPRGVLLAPSSGRTALTPETTMQSKARIFGHSIHQALVVFPLGLLATSLIFDLIHVGTGSARMAEVSFFMISAGILGGLLAAVFGLIDFVGIPNNTRAKRIGLAHGIGNVVVVGLFILSW